MKGWRQGDLGFGVIAANDICSTFALVLLFQNIHNLASLLYHVQVLACVGCYTRKSWRGVSGLAVMNGEVGPGCSVDQWTRVGRLW
jgi:hypothetical protein